MKRIQISFVGARSGHGVPGDDVPADRFLIRAGFRNRFDPTNALHLYGGCSPVEGNEFFVEYTKPPSEGTQGFCRLIRFTRGEEGVIDEGAASAIKPGGGLGDFHIEGVGTRLKSWLFYFTKESLDEASDSP